MLFFIIILREYNLENDPTCLYQVAQAIMLIQNTYGPIQRVWGKGTAAKHTWDLVTRLQRENGLNENRTHQRSCIDQMLLIDRSVDQISPLATQLTYEGLIDEIFGKTGNCKLSFKCALYNSLTVNYFA